MNDTSIWKKEKQNKTKQKQPDTNRRHMQFFSFGCSFSVYRAAPLSFLWFSPFIVVAMWDTASTHNIRNAISKSRFVIVAFKLQCQMELEPEPVRGASTKRALLPAAVVIIQICMLLSWCIDMCTMHDTIHNALCVVPLYKYSDFSHTTHHSH